MMEQVVRVGRQAALAAGAVQRLSYLKPHRIILKGDIDPVTEADLRCQELIINLIRQVFPDHGFLAEETLGEAGQGPGPSPQAPLPTLYRGWRKQNLWFRFLRPMRNHRGLREGAWGCPLPQTLLSQEAVVREDLADQADDQLLAPEVRFGDGVDVPFEEDAVRLEIAQALHRPRGQGRLSANPNHLLHHLSHS